MAYKKISSAEITLTKYSDLNEYSAEIFSSNGTILQPYDTETVLTGIIYKNNIDITDKCTDFRWLKYTPSKDNMVLDEEWCDKHRGSNSIKITKDDIDSKAIFYFEVYKNISHIPNDDTLLASANITVIDVNDLLVSTDKPEDPYEGQVWIDDSTDPATIYIWNGYKWIIAGAVGAVIKNLLRDTGFLGFTTKFFLQLGDSKNSYIPSIIDHLSKRYMVVSSDVPVLEHRGVYQITTDHIMHNSDYSFQMLFYTDKKTETYSNKIFLDIYSIDKFDEQTLLLHKELEAEENVKQCLFDFDTRSNTEKIKVEIYGENGYRFNFKVAELALYNTDTLYPWTPHPLDLSDVMNLDRNTLFNILTDNGMIEGIFQRINPETGQVQYFINASYIGAGLLSAQYIDAYGLTVRRKDDPSIKTLEITQNGDINLRVNSLTIQATGQSLDEYIASKIPEINPDLKPTGDALDTLENEINKEQLTIRFKRNLLMDTTEFIDQQLEPGELETWLTADEISNTNIVKKSELLEYLYNCYMVQYNTLKDTITIAKKDYELTLPTLNTAKEKYNEDYARINNFYSSCDKYLQDLQIETLLTKWSELKLNQDKISANVGKLEETVGKQGEDIVGFENKLNDALLEITPEKITQKVTEVITTDEGVKKHITSVSEQTATSITNTVKDELSGNISKIEQTVDGIKEQIESFTKNHNYKLIMEAPDGTVIMSAATTTTVLAKVYDWDEDITDSLDASYFNWYRRSRNFDEDTYWHEQHGVGKKVITITASDITNYATFYFTVTIPDNPVDSNTP